MSTEPEIDLDNLFPEPPRPPSPEPTTVIYEREDVRNGGFTAEDDFKHANSSSWNQIKLRLVGSHPLWGHYLWNAARAIAAFLDTNTNLYAGRRVLELGAGAGLPSLITIKNGAAQVFITDYPDEALVENIRFNVAKNTSDEESKRVHVSGYIWGQPIQRIQSTENNETFDLVILSDLIFNHSQHAALLKTCDMALSQNTSLPAESQPCILVFYTHHRPHLAKQDLAFFDLAREQGWNCDEIYKKRFNPMFPEDPGEADVRATVHGWKLTRNTS